MHSGFACVELGDGVKLGQGGSFVNHSSAVRLLKLGPVSGAQITHTGLVFWWLCERAFRRTLNQQSLCPVVRSRWRLRIALSRFRRCPNSGAGAHPSNYVCAVGKRTGS